MIKVLLSLCLLVSISGMTREFKKVEFPEEMAIGETKLALNGFAARKFWEIIDVYLIALYLEAPSTSSQEILDSKNPKIIKMHFVRHVDRKKLQDSLKEGFFKNAAKDYKYSEDVRMLTDIMPFFKAGESMDMFFYPDRVDFKIKDGDAKTVSGEQFSYTMLKIFVTNSDFTGLLAGK